MPRFLLLALLFSLAACSDSRDVMEELPNSSIAGAAREGMTDTQIESTLARPVTIGEDGPRLAACGALGIVQGLGTRTLALRSAPFDAAKASAQLAEGARLHICARSLDQRWLGVVVAPLPMPPTGDDATEVDDEGPLDCGVSSPVERKLRYDGPCASGWVSSGFVRLIAD